MYTHISKLKYLISKSIIGKIIRHLHITRLFNYPFELYENYIWSKYDGEVVSLEDFKIVLDIGSHIGWYTLIASKIVGKKGKVYWRLNDNLISGIREGLHN